MMTGMMVLNNIVKMLDDIQTWLDYYEHKEHLTIEDRESVKVLKIKHDTIKELLGQEVTV